MKVVERHLSGGFNDRRIRPIGILIHYTSAVHTQPDDPHDVDAIIGILDEHDLAYHALIGRDGTVYELVPTPLRAWHAGESKWRGRSDCNSWMLGVALVGQHDEPFTDEQYRALSEWIARNVERYPIRPEHITGHEHVAPERKKDPGPSFDWNRLNEAICGLWEPKKYDGLGGMDE